MVPEVRSVSAGGLSIRRARREDLGAVAELVRLATERDYDVRTVERMVCRLEPDLYHGWLAFAGDKPVGLTMLQAKTLRWGERTFRAGYWTNLFVHPDYRGTRLYPRLPFAMFKGAEEVRIDFLYTVVRRPQVAAAHLAIGMCRIGELPVLAKPLRPVRLIAKYKQLGGRAALLSVFPDGLYAAYLRLRRWRPSREFSIEELEWNSSEVPLLMEILRASAQGRVHQAWTSDSFRHRFEANPDGAPYVLLGVRRKGCLVAGAVYRMAERGNQIRAGVVMEVIHEEKESEAARVCLMEVERRACREGAEVLLALAGWGGNAHEILKQLGYMRSPETYVFMWRKTAAVPENLPVAELWRWRFVFADHDAF